jgi:hypothetical protein
MSNETIKPDPDSTEVCRGVETFDEWWNLNYAADPHCEREQANKEWALRGWMAGQQNQQPPGHWVDYIGQFISWCPEHYLQRDLLGCVIRVWEWTYQIIPPPPPPIESEDDKTCEWAYNHTGIEIGDYFTFKKGWNAALAARKELPK